MIRLFFSGLLVMTAFIPAFCQLPYTFRQYNITKDSAVWVDSVPNYCGRMENIRVNIYKPIGDNNTKRPVILCVHGGGFTSPDNANEYQMSVFAQEFARRGYVGVTIDYREGFHLRAFATGLPAVASYDLPVLAAYNNSDGGAFVQDSAEIDRSVYRAQQDLKGIIRWMKGRNETDSTSLCKYFTVGFSAGAITVLHSAFMDDVTERPAETFTLTDASNPEWDNLFLQIPGPLDKDDQDYRSHNPVPFNYNAAPCYTRSELGDIDGPIARDNSFSTKVMGVAGLSGALFENDLFDINHSTPAVYLYHVPADDVVPVGVGKPLAVLSYVFNPSPDLMWPVAYGSSWIWQKLNHINYPGRKHFQIYHGTVPFLTSPHNLLPDAFVLSDSLAMFYGQVIADNESCDEISSTNVTEKSDHIYLVSPNPASSFVEVHLLGNSHAPEIKYTLYNSSGLMIKNGSWPGINSIHRIDLHDLLPGVYFLEILDGAVIKRRSFMLVR